MKEVENLFRNALFEYLNEDIRENNGLIKVGGESLGVKEIIEIELLENKEFNISLLNGNLNKISVRGALGLKEVTNYGFKKSCLRFNLIDVCLKFSNGIFSIQNIENCRYSR